MTEPSAAAAAQPSPPSDHNAPFQPFIPAQTSGMRELTGRGLVLGSVLGIIFAYTSVWLGLKVGLTVSASIPVAVLSITIFRWLSGRMGMAKPTILENNIVQTTGSAGESIAAGVAFTLPSLLLMGFEMELTRILLVALLGGLIGVLMMIPLRQGLIVKEHGKLAYPEGTACADVLIVGEQGGTNAKTVFLGFFVGLFYAFINTVLHLWQEASTWAVTVGGRLKGGLLSFEVSPAMLGVGYIIGPRVAANMMAGGVTAFLIMVPLAHLFGDALTTPMFPETRLLISEMNPFQIRNAYILYIGAGAVATGGFISLARSIPTIIGAFRGGLKSFLDSRGAQAPQTQRTDRDLPMTVVLGGSIALTVAIWVAPVLEINLLSAILILLFGFFFVTVSSRITGEIGSSSNPISGMTVATLLLTCGLFVGIGWTGVGYKAMALTTAALVCVAASNGGTTSQDLKTGFLVGATPKYQQIAMLVGVITSAVVIGWTLQKLNQTNNTYRAVEFPAFTAPLAADAPKELGPDKQTEYRVFYLHEDEGEVQRGKYLVDGAGKLAFLVDPGVCGTFPYKLKPASFSSPLAVPADAPAELGLDRKPYRVVTLKEAAGEIPAGRYLATPEGQVAYEMAHQDKYDAPKAQLFRLIIDGTLGGKLPWGLVLVGVFLALVVELLGVTALPFAVGLYLPISTSAGIFVGGLVRWLVDRKRQDTTTSAEFSPGVLMAAGLIAGGAITSVLKMFVVGFDLEATFDFSTRFGLAHNETWWPMLPFLVMAAAVYVVGTRKEEKAG